MVCTGLMMWVAVFWAYTIGTFSTILSTMDTPSVQFRQTLDMLNTMLRDNRIPVDMRPRVRSYFHATKQLQRASHYHECYDLMSATLRRDVRAASYASQLQSVWYLENLTNEFVIELSQYLKPMIFAPMETIDMPNKLYINRRGLAARKGRPLGRGSCWGVEFLLNVERLGDTTCAMALTYLEILVLDRDDMLHVVEEFPEEGKVIMRAAAFYALKHAFLRMVARRRLEREREQNPQLGSDKDRSLLRKPSEKKRGGGGSQRRKRTMALRSVMSSQRSGSMNHMSQSELARLQVRKRSSIAGVAIRKRIVNMGKGQSNSEEQESSIATPQMIGDDEDAEEAVQRKLNAVMFQLRKQEKRLDTLKDEILGEMRGVLREHRNTVVRR